MVLARLIKGLLGPQQPAAQGRPATWGETLGEVLLDPRRKVLNVGGSSKKIAIPEHYAGWLHLLLDVSPGPGVDLVKDARELSDLPAGLFDAVYCSHNLEHYFRHEARTVLRGFLTVLKEGGFVEIRVPDLQAVLRKALERGLDIDDTLYVSAAGPITVHDVLYGLGRQIEESGQPWYAHKCGFTPKTLERLLNEAGFANVSVTASEAALEVRAVAFKAEASKEARTRLAL